MYETFASDKIDNNGLYFFVNQTKDDDIQGYTIDFYKSYKSPEGLKKYIILLNEIDDGINKLKELYKVDIIQFSEELSLDIGYSK